MFFCRIKESIGDLSQQVKAVESDIDRLVWLHVRISHPLLIACLRLRQSAKEKVHVKDKKGVSTIAEK